MARQIKWRLQFKSLNDTGCLVNIYEEGYNGSSADTTKTGADVPFAVETGVTELIGGAVPFEYQEDDSSNLLEFIRIKTGVIRVIETTYGELDNLNPTSIRHHFVEAYYGTERVFTGFMQCQEFSNPWVASPRELEFSIVSPLGLLSSFNFVAPQTPGLVTLGSLMNEVMIGLNPSATDNTVSDYNNVIYPGESDYLPWKYYINSLVVCPFNEDFKHYDTGQLYSPKDYAFYVGGICACFGWIAHDTPSGIVFVQYNYPNNKDYQKLSVAGLSSFTGIGQVQQLATAFNNYYSNADDNAMQSVVMPLKELTLSVEGADISQKELTTKYSTTNGRLMSGGDTYRALSLTALGPDVDGTNIGTAIFDTGGNLYNNGLFPIAYAKINSGDLSVNIDEFWAIKYSSSWSPGEPMMTAKFFGMLPNDKNFNCLLKIKIARGTSLQTLDDSGYDTFSLNLVIKVDDKYYVLDTDTLTPNLTFNYIEISGTTGRVVPNKSLDAPLIGPVDDIGDADGIMFNIGIAMIGVLEVSLYPNNTYPLDDNDCLKITELKLSNPGAIDKAYYPEYRHQSEIKVGNNNTGVESADVTVNFSNYSSSRGDNSFGTKQDGPVANHPTFPYMFSPLNVLTQRVKKSAAVNFNEYAAKWTYWISGWRWRMIAKNFNMRDDEFTVTLARSSTIE